MPMGRREIISALVLLVFSALYFWATFYIPDRTIPNTPGPSFFPHVIVTLVAILSVALFFNGYKKLRDGEGPVEAGESIKAASWTLFAFVIFLLALEPIGFLLSAIPFFAILMLLFGSRSPLQILIGSVTIPVVLFFIFSELFQILLPEGPLGF